MQTTLPLEAIDRKILVERLYDLNVEETTFNVSYPKFCAKNLVEGSFWCR
jgi:hypothetical protein